jgi:hypothetical protein
MTLKDLVEKHPEWLDHELVVYREDGEYDYVGKSGWVNEGEDVTVEDGKLVKHKVLVFAGN